AVGEVGGGDGAVESTVADVNHEQVACTAGCDVVHSQRHRSAFDDVHVEAVAGGAARVVDRGVLDLGVDVGAEGRVDGDAATGRVVNGDVTHREVDVGPVGADV